MNKRERQLIEIDIAKFDKEEFDHALN